MSLPLPSANAAMPPGKPSAASPARRSEQEPDAPERFGDVLSRSLKPAGESAEKPGTKPVTPASARRQADEDRTDLPALLSATVLALVPPPESKVMPGAHARGALDVATATAAAAPPTEPAASLAADTDAADVAADLKPAQPGTPPQAAAVSALMAAIPGDIAESRSQASLNAARTDASMTLVPGTSAVPARAGDAGTSDPSSHGDDRTPHPPVTGTARLAAVAASLAPADEAAAIMVGAGQAPAADTLSPVAALLPLAAANAMAPNPASAVAAASPAAPATPVLAPEVGSSEWGKALGQQVVQLGHAGQQHAELQLNPPGLGPLKVTLSLNDHQIQAMFVSAHASVRAAVEAALPQLRASLADNGISLGNTSVSADSQQQAAFTQGQNGQADRRAYPDNGLPSMSLMPSNPAATLPSEPLRPTHGISVDTYA